MEETTWIVIGSFVDFGEEFLENLRLSSVEFFTQPVGNKQGFSYRQIFPHFPVRWE